MLTVLPSSRQILTTSYYCRLLGFAEASNVLSYQNKSKPIASELRSIFDRLQQQQNGGLAFRVAMSMPLRGGKADALSALIDQPHVSHIIKAKAQIELANVLLDPAQRCRRQTLYDTAKKSVKLLHAHATVDITVEQWAAGLIEIMDTDHARLVYEELGYLNGLKNVIHKELDQATLQHNHELEERFERELISLSAKGGMMLTLAMSHMNLIQRFSLWSGSDDMVLNAAMAALQQMETYELPFQKGQCAYVLCEIAMRRGNFVTAVDYSLKCQTEWSQCSKQSESMSATLRARAELGHLKSSQTGSVGDLRDRFSGEADRDLRNSVPGEAISKLELLLDPIFSTENAGFIAYRTSPAGVVERIQEILNGYAGSDKDNRIANFFQFKAIRLMSDGFHRTDCELEVQAYEAFKEALSLRTKDAKDKPTFETTTINMQMGLVAHTVFQKQLGINKVLAHRVLNDAIAIYTSCIDDSAKLGQLSLMNESKYWVALTKYEAAIIGIVSIENALEAALAVERAFDEQRNEISVTTGISAVQAKQFLAKDKHVRDIYRFAFQLCLFNRDDEIGAWEWVQKAKARSLSDTLGLGAIVPASILNSISGDPEALSMFEEERRLVDDLQQSDIAQRFYKNTDLRKYRTKMRSRPSLRDLFGLREGIALTSKMLQNACADTATGLASQSFLFVDWYLKSDEIHLMIHPSNGSPRRRFLGISASSVQAWVNEYLRTAEGKSKSIRRDENHPSQPLRALDVLIEPLAEFSEEGQILVLSPSGPIEAVPLHALRFPVWSKAYNPKKPCLIERHPVVYCANATAFVQCSRAAAAKVPSRDFTASVYSVYEPYQDAIYEEDEQLQVYEAAEKLAMQLHCVPVIGKDATATKLREEWPQSDFIHFHGHCDPSPAVITEQSLVVAADSSLMSNVGKPHKSHANYSVREFFDLRLRSPHISLMACGSASQTISPGDEPLGIVTALLCAGAASIVGTMWPVASSSARKFTEYFQAELFGVNTVQQSHCIHANAIGNPVLNLAVALQRAVVKMKGSRETRLPYDWAPFVLHGSYFMQKPRMWSGMDE
jgi:CHAT domain-containing protein